MQTITMMRGNVTKITGNTALAQTNPLRYRSYYYDSETGYYHLKSRYYSPKVGRFLNADGYVQTGQGLLDKNMFAYCGNNPVETRKQVFLLRIPHQL